MQMHPVYFDLIAFGPKRRVSQIKVPFRNSEQWHSRALTHQEAEVSLLSCSHVLNDCQTVLRRDGHNPQVQPEEREMVEFLKWTK